MADYVITFKVKDQPPIVMGMDSTEADARALCRKLISSTDNGRATLCLLDASGLLYMVGRWDHTTMAALVPIESTNNTVRPRPAVRPAENSAPAQPAQDAEVPAEAQQPAQGEESTPETQDSGEVYRGYCVKCHENREFHGEVVDTANGRRMAKGRCPVCGSGVNRILKNVQQEDWAEPAETPRKRSTRKAGESAREGDNRGK